jgi:PAS domain S-box-containing protein
LTVDADQRHRRGRRLRQIAFISCLLLLLVAAWFTRGTFSVRSLLGLEAPGDALTLVALSTLNLVALVTLALVLVRHLLKLARERRAGRLGSQFKTRMVVGSIALTLLPTAMLFLFSFWLVDTSIRVFQQPAEQIGADAKSILRDYVDVELRDLHATARRMVRANALRGPEPVDRPTVEAELRREARALRIATIELRGGGLALATADGPDADLEPIFRDAVAAARAAVDAGQSYHGQARTSDDSSAIFMVVGLPIAAKSDAPRGLVVARRFSPALAMHFESIADQQLASERLVQQQNSVRMRYVAALSLVTLIVLFATVWIALFVSRSVTEPIQALVEATGEVARGNLNHRIDCAADGELATLVDSFNAMAAQLGESRRRLIEAALELEMGNKRLEERRAYIETVLAGLSTGVISVDAEGRVTMVNQAAARMLGLGPGPYEIDELGAAVGPARARVETLLRRARRTGSASSDMELQLRDGTSLSVAVSVAPLLGPDGEYAGAVVTVEDLSELIKAERTSAWNEVARRMAHEIKNPLTPIQLSAERIARGIKREEPRASERFTAIVEESTATIVREVGALQHMVEEFASYARMPRPRFEGVDLNAIVRTALELYEERFDGVTVDADLAPDVPTLQLDPEQIRRVFVNLVDNAVEAVSASAERRVRVVTRHDASRDTVTLAVEDTGHGIDATARDRLFLPYFSTRTRGTGLGLAIVSHIVADHKGRVWAESKEPAGARFVVEFPVHAEGPVGGGTPSRAGEAVPTLAPDA